MLRILFIQASHEERPEYTDHLLLVNHGDPNEIEGYFIWQKPTDSHIMETHSKLHNRIHHFYHDFGRSKDHKLVSNRWKRILKMAWCLPSSLVYMLKIMLKVKPDVIYTSQQWFDIFLVSFLQLFFKLPHIIHIHYTIGPWLGKLTLHKISKSRNLLVVSDFIRQQALDFGIKPAYVDTIYNPIDVARFNISKSTINIRQEFNWKDNAPLIVSVARIDPNKGFELLLEAFAILQKDMPEARLLICGETTLTTGYDLQIKQKALNLGLKDCVVFAGWRRDLPQIFSGADVFCLASQDEPFGLVFGEAMVSGLPVVACNSGAVNELVLNGETGLISELGDAPALAYNLLKLLKNKDLASKMGAAGRKRAFAKFKPELVAERWTQLLYKHINKSDCIES